jgi:L-amino acid N-acyltransferase YncA
MTRIRPATREDAAALAAIYGYHVANGFGSFEETAPSAEVMAERWAAITARGLPYLVAEVDGAVAGLAYAGPYRPRPGYRFSVEDSVYISPAHQGQGLGKALLTAIIDACETMGLRRMLAFIGDSGNAGSIGVHRSCGFRHAGVLERVGFKAGRWLDVVVMERDLGGEPTATPTTPGLDLSGG